MTTTLHTPDTPTPDTDTTVDIPADDVIRVIAKRSFATVATTSPAGWPHVAGVVYDSVVGRTGPELWIHTMRSSRKGRNVAANPRAAVCIPFRRLPAGPPFTVQFQADAELVAMDDPAVLALLDAGELGHVSGHGALDEPDGVFVRLRPRGPVHTYGLGVSALALIRDPLHVGAGTVDLREANRG